MANPGKIKTDQGFLGSVDIRKGKATLDVAIDQSDPGASNAVALTGMAYERLASAQEETNRLLRALCGMIEQAFATDPLEEFLGRDENQ